MDPSELTNFYNIKILENYVTNVTEILEEVYKHPKDLFKSRSEGPGSYKFITLDGKGASMSTMMYHNFSKKLKKLCIKTVNFGKFFPPDQIAINKYPPGSYLGKHKDGTGKYWKFQLIFLQSTKSHFTWYDRENKPHLVEEIPGRGLEIPVHIIHESTEIDQDETTKYSMVFIWDN